MNASFLSFIGLIITFSTHCSAYTTPRTPKKRVEASADYQPKIFDFSDVSGFSKEQLQQHVQLYQGYVKKRNEIEQSLKTVDRTTANNITYSPFRELKIEQTFAFNGVVLHELYFQNLGAGTTMGSETQALLIKYFGSIEQFKKDIMACAGCARGWAITAYSITDRKIYNFVLDAHNQTVPILIVPLLVIDTYEHAYMIDFGINRAQYLKIVWETINWDIVEKRVMWLKKLEV